MTGIDKYKSYVHTVLISSLRPLNETLINNFFLHIIYSLAFTLNPTVIKRSFFDKYCIGPSSLLSSVKFALSQELKHLII